MADPLIIRLRELAPFADDRAAMRALEATVNALWIRLYPEERAQLAAELPSPVAERLQAPGPPGAVRRRRSRFAADVARKEDVPLPLATEHMEVVCRALSELMQTATRTWLAERLPEVAELFELPQAEQPPEHERPSSPEAARNLASGRPGSTHPLSSANPELLAHEHSVARSDDPHASSKLSSARGLSQERDHRTLANGRPGSRRPLSGGR